MRRSLFALLVLAVVFGAFLVSRDAPTASTPPAPSAAPAGDSATAARDSAAVAITGVTVIDVEQGRHVANQTVLVRGTRIAALGADGSVTVPSGATVVDGRGRFLLPGLWDMHAHVDDAAPWAFPLYVANGVTGIRDMGSHLDRLRGWRAGEAAAAVMPRVVAAGPIVTGLVDDADPRLVRVADSAGAERAVDTLVRRGVQLVKVHDWLTPAAYGGVLAAARRHGLAVAGHVPVAIHPADAARRGQRTIEHQGSAWADFVVYASSSESTWVRRARALVGRPVDPSRLIGSWPVAELDSLTASFSEAKADSLARAIAASDAWVTPTLHVFSTVHLLPPDSAASLRSPRLRHLPDPVRARLPAILGDMARAGREPGRLAARARLRDLHAGMVRRLHQAGVPLLAGSDAAPAYGLTVPGYTLHDELEALQHAGVPAAAVLRAATLEPARALGATDSLGTVAVGRLADLVLLDADPLADVANTTRIHAVVANGRLFDRAALDRLLAR